MRTTKKHIEMFNLGKHGINQENTVFLRMTCYENMRFHGHPGNQRSMRTKHTHWVLDQYKHQRTKDESKMVFNMVFKCVVST